MIRLALVIACAIVAAVALRRRHPEPVVRWHEPEDGIQGPDPFTLALADWARLA